MGLYTCCDPFFVLARIGLTTSTSKVEKDQTVYDVQVLALPFINLLFWSNISPISSLVKFYFILLSLNFFQVYNEDNSNTYPIIGCDYK